MTLPPPAVRRSEFRLAAYAPCQPFSAQRKSLREAAALQSFRDQYRFFGTNTDIAQQVGNAAPVRLAECLAGTSCACNERPPSRPLEPMRLGRS